MWGLTYYKLPSAWRPWPWRLQVLRAALRTNGTTTNRQRGPAALCRLPGASVRRARVNRRSDRSHWPRPPCARSKDAQARARLSHSGRCGGSHHSIVGSPQTATIADLPDRRAPTGFGLLQRLCRFGLGLGDFWISARLNALFDDAEFDRRQAAVCRTAAHKQHIKMKPKVGRASLLLLVLGQSVRG